MKDMRLKLKLTLEIGNLYRLYSTSLQYMRHGYEGHCKSSFKEAETIQIFNRL
jgi:hypothetical protein